MLDEIENYETRFFGSQINYASQKPETLGEYDASGGDLMRKFEHMTLLESEDTKEKQTFSKSRCPPRLLSKKENNIILLTDKFVFTEINATGPHDLQ